jgi:hypothetical protein
VATVNLEGYRPLKKYNNAKWTSVKIYEAPDSLGPWTQIDTQALPDYPDPLLPPVFNFTTNSATAPSDKWYRVEFYDLVGGYQDSVPEYNGTVSAAVPTTEWIRETSKISFGEYGYPEPTDGPDPLEVPLAESVVQFQATTGIDLTTVLASDDRNPLIRAALRMFVEYHVASGTQEVLDTVADYDLLSSMSADGYTESRRGVVGVNPNVLHPWPALGRLLSSIIYFGQGGAIDEAPAVGVIGVNPRPGKDFIGSPGSWDGPFGPPATVWPRVGYKPDGFTT